MSERFQIMSKKYMCTWLPEEALSVCVFKIHGNESPSAIDCLLCVSRTFASEAECLWTVLRYPVATAKAAQYLEELKASHESIKLALSVMSKKFKPDYRTDDEEAWANTVEALLEKLKEVKMSE